MPWEPGGKLRLARSGKVWRHVVFGGVYDLSKIRDVLVSKYGQDDPEAPTRGQSALFAASACSLGDTDRRLPSRARQDVRRLEAHQVVFTPVALRIGGETIRVPKPGTFQLVPDAAGVGEPGLPHLQRQMVAKCRLRFVRQVVGRPAQHQPSDREQLVDLVLGEVQVMRNA
jgi:hypothetical protein